MTHVSHPAVSASAQRRNWIGLALAVAATLPWLFLIFFGPHDAQGHLAQAPLTTSLWSGLAILGAAFLLSWAAEVAQLDMAQALALVILSLIAILPEYSVDMAFAIQAGKGLAASQNPATANLPATKALLENAHYAVANMTGANRILIGMAWSAVVFIYCWRKRVKSVEIEPSRAIEIKYLLLATLYSFTLPLKALLFNVGIHPVDALVLVMLFGFYTRAASKTEHVEPKLVGPPAAMATLPQMNRRALCLGLFVFSAWTIYLAAHPFAEGLVKVGEGYKINEFLLVQWIAPLASEMPEFIVAGLFAWRGFPALGMGTLISSKVNQWTLLVGLLPIVYSFASRQFVAMPLDEQQLTEVLLTSAQSLFAVSILMNFSITLAEAGALLGLFLAQFLTQMVIAVTHPETSLAAAEQARVLTQTSQLGFSALYIGLALFLVFSSREKRAGLRSLFARAPQTA